MKNAPSLTAVIAVSFLLAAGALAQQRSEYNSFGQDQKAVEKAEQQWTDAMARAKIDMLQDILADDYTLIDPDGKPVTKAGELAMYQSGDLKIESLTTDELKVKVYVGAAVATGRATVKAKYKDTDMSGEYRFTDVLEPRKGGWKAVSRQLTKVKTNP